MTIKHLLVFSVAASCLPTFAAQNDKQAEDNTPAQKVNIVKVIDFTKPRRTEAAQKANIDEILAATERAPIKKAEVIPSPRIEPLTGSMASANRAVSTASSKDDAPVTKYNGKRSYSYIVRGKRYQTYAQSNGFVQEGMASWYGNPFHGRKTANGEIYNMNEMTAAHKELPLGTRVEVTNLSNGRKVIVRVNDRGPFHGNRVLDLSRAAAKELGTLDSGVAKVRIRALH